MMQFNLLHSTTRKVLKALSIFGSVQAVTMLCSVVRVKIVSILLGPGGVGMINLLNSPNNLIYNSLSLNLRQSGVQFISSEQESARQLHAASLAQSLAIALGVAGALLMAVLAPAFSYWSFGDFSHTFDYLLLAPVNFFLSLAAGNDTVMQGRSRLKPLAKATVWAALVSISVAVPLIYWLEMRGIIPMLLCYAFFSFMFSRIFCEKIPAAKLTVRDLFHQTKPMLKLGAYISLSMIFTLAASYIFTAYLNRTATESAVGIYQAGYTIVNTYMGMIFAAIAVEFFPRLSGVISSRTRTEVMVSHEIKISQWVLLPLCVVLIIFAPLAVRILYSESFLEAVPFIGVATVGIAFRAFSTCIAYTILAKADGKIYIFTEALSAVLYVVFNITFYNLWGYVGLGWAYLAWYASYSVSVYAVYRLRYRLRLRRGILALLVLSTAASLLTLYLTSAFYPQ